MKSILLDFKYYLNSLRGHSLAFYMACAYVVFTYIRPQEIYPFLNILPWTQLAIVIGLGSAIIRKDFHFEGVHWWLLLFVLVAFISITQSTYPQISQAKQDVILIWYIEVLFFVNCIRTRAQFFLIVVLFLLAMFKMSFFGARVWIGRGFGFTEWGIAGPAGFFSNSGEFSLLMAMVVVISIAFLVGTKKFKSWYLLLPVTAAMTVMGASSRGGQLALIVGLLYLIWRYKKLNFKYLIIFSILGYTALSLIPEEQMERFESMGSDNTSQSRLSYWSAGWDMMVNYPIFGVGYYGFPEHYSRNYKVTDPDNPLTNRMEVSHNSFIEIGSTMGFVGLASYLILLIYIYHCSRSVQKSEKISNYKNIWLYDFSIGVQASTIVYIIGSFFMSVAFYPYIYLLLMFAALLKKVRLPA